MKNPKNFKLKIVPIWGNSFVEFHWSINKGLSWNVIKYCDVDGVWEGIYDMYSMIPVRHGLTLNSNFDFEKDKWSTYEKVIEYDKKEREKVKKNNEDLILQQKNMKKK